MKALRDEADFIITNPSFSLFKEFLPWVVEEKSILIYEERLKDIEARKFIDNAFRDGLLRTTGTDIDKIMPPVSRFGGGNRAEKKNGIIAKLTVFFEKYLGLV